MLRLIDFSPLRAELVQLLRLQVNGPGGPPFDPVSVFLCALLRWETHRGWDKVAQLLGSAEGACWRRWCGFAPESFFSTLKRECVKRHHFTTRKEAKRTIFEYLEVFYNWQRLQSTLDYQSPAEYELTLI